MTARSVSTLVLGFGVLIGNSGIPLPLRILACILSVIYFWWAHGFRIAGANLRLLAMLLSSIALFWHLGGNIGITGVPGFENLPSDYEFDPSQIKRLKSSNRVALRLTLDHRPTEEERYLRIGAQHPLKLQSGSLKSTSWAKEHLLGLPLEEKLRKIRDWFSKSFRYTLDSEWSTLDSFLFETRYGYCQHFSYATFELLSLSGEKPQMIYGYSGGSWNPLLRTLTYLDSDAHSWLEVWDTSAHHSHRIDPTTWVTRIDQVSPDSTATRAPFRTGVGLALLLSFWIVLFLFRDPRMELSRILGTKGPILDALSSQDSALSRIKNDYELLYFAKPSNQDRIDRSIRSIRLRISILFLRIRLAGIRRRLI
jgi:hypothetical protein